MPPISLNIWIATPLLLGAIQGVFLALLLPRFYRTNLSANKALSILLWSGSCSLLLYVFTAVYGYFPRRSIVFIDSFAFLFAPFTYLYFLRLLFPSRRATKFEKLLFLPSAVHTVYGMALFRHSEESMAQLVFYNAFEKEWLFIFGFLVIWTMFFWFAALRLFLKFLKKTKNLVPHKPKIHYLFAFLLALFLGNVISIVFAMDFFFQVRLFSFTQTYVGWTIIPFLIYMLSYVAMGRPELLTVSYEVKKNQVTQKQVSEIEALKSSLETLMRREHLYRNPKLSLPELAEQLGVGPTKLSNTINHCYATNFYDFLNRYRLQDFIHKLEHWEHQKHTLLALAYEVGFNSKTTFYKSFKKSFRLTPSEYIDQMNKP